MSSKHLYKYFRRYMCAHFVLANAGLAGSCVMAHPLRNTVACRAVTDPASLHKGTWALIRR
jgi:hypothetical protein